MTVDAIWPVPECSTALTQFALEQNLKALQAFRSETPSAEEVLASCLVFVRFEILQGEFLEAIRILSKGLSVHQEQVGFSQGQEASEIDYEITYAFSRLRMRYSTSIGDWQCLQQHMLEDKEQSDSFLNLKEARQFFDTLADQTSAVITQLRNPEPGQDNPDTAKYSLMCERDWVIWRQKFDNFITSYREQTPDNLERQAMLLLRMHQLVAWVRLHTASSPSEMVYDAFMTEYREIVRAAEEFMGLIDPGAKTTGSSFQSQSIIAFDLGVITPLAFVAITCRDFILRRRCVELLYRRHRREDLWDSHLVAVVSAAIIDLEEEPSSQIANLKKHEPGQQYLPTPSPSPTADHCCYAALSSSPSPKANVSLDLLPSEKRIRCVDFARSVLGPSPNEGNRMMVEERIGYKRFPWDQTVIVESVAKTVQIRRTMAPMNVGPSVLFQNIMYFGSGLGAWNSPMPSKHSAASN